MHFHVFPVCLMCKIQLACEAGKHVAVEMTETFVQFFVNKYLFTSFLQPHWKLPRNCNRGELEHFYVMLLKILQIFEKLDIVHIFSASYPPGAKRT